MSKGIRVNQLAKELGVESKSILAKCREEGLAEKVPNHMSVLSLGLAETVREWFSGGGGVSTAVEIAAPVDVATKPRTVRKTIKKKLDDDELPPATTDETEVAAPPVPEIETHRPIVAHAPTHVVEAPAPAPVEGPEITARRTTHEVEHAPPPAPVVEEEKAPAPVAEPIIIEPVVEAAAPIIAAPPIAPVHAPKRREHWSCRGACTARPTCSRRSRRTPRASQNHSIGRPRRAAAHAGAQARANSRAKTPGSQARVDRRPANRPRGKAGSCARSPRAWPAHRRRSWRC